MNYCIDCGKEISSRSKRCLSCCQRGSLNHRWKGGEPKCIDCGKQLKNRYATRCQSCAAKKTHWDCSGKNNPMYGVHMSGKDNPRWKGGRNSYYGHIANAVYREHNINVICGQCGTVDNICIHHKDKNIKNNRLSNLQALCNSCHSKLHRKKDKCIRPVEKY